MFRGKSGDSGVITATLKIPVPASTSLALGPGLGLDDSDIPFIEDQDRHYGTAAVLEILGITRKKTIK